MPIRPLSPEVIAQIAAGEVIERPASVVKELIENALDASARTITVHIAAAGRKRIDVADDGTGIPPSELDLAVSRHATSKLTCAEDLFSITTLGFRGEALASIAAVSRFTITSRTADQEMGARLRVEGGIKSSLEPIGAPVGTVVRVDDLFYNVPARLKFLKSDLTERRAIDQLLTRYALAYPQVRFKFTDERTTVLQTAGDGDRRAILAALYGIDVAKQLMEVMAEEDGLRLTGYISPSTVTRSHRRDITFFVNGRWIQDAPLAAALIQAYHTLLMVGRYPLAVLFLEIRPEEVDVNVHPAKAEVRFRNPDQVFRFVQRAVRRTLLAYSPIPSVTPSLWRPSPSDTSPRTIGLEWQLAGEASRPKRPQPSDTTPSPSEAPSGPARSLTPSLPLLRLIGQVGQTYLVAEGPDGLYLIDQHAAHERILFEKWMEQYTRRQIPAQALLSPAVVHLAPAEARTLLEHLPILKRFGFEVEEFGPNTFQVRAIPTLFAQSSPELALRALVEDFEEDETPLQNEIEARIAARVCKRLAVKAGQTLSAEEQRALLNDLEACESPRTCPHGRPTMIHLSVDMLEKQFGRKK